MREMTLVVWSGGQYGDNPECDCGNNVSSWGFYPTLLDGTMVEPDDELWSGSLYKCVKCDLVGIVVKEEVN